MTAPSIAQRLGRHVARAGAAPLDADVRQKAATCLLDALALGIAAGAEPTTRALLGSTLLAQADRGCRVWPDGRRAPFSEAVLLNGYAVHARFQDDTDMTAWAHPGSLIVPPVVAAAEAVGASLEQVLAGIVCGYSALSWLGAEETVGRSVVARSFRGSPTLGPIGAAAGTAGVLGLDAAQAADAVSIAASSAGGLVEPVGAGSDDWRFQNGSAAWRGGMAALLAQRGITGSAGAFESPRGFVKAFAGLDGVAGLARDPDPRSILAVWTKPYPALGDNMAVIAAAASIRAEHAVADDAIAAVRIHQNSEFAAYPGTSHRGPFSTATQAIASTTFGVAAALSRGTITYDLYATALDDPVILSLIDRSTVIAEDDYAYLDGRVVVELRDGRTLSRDAADLPQTLFYRDDATASAAFAGTVGEAGASGDATAFAEGLLARVAGGDTGVPAATVVDEAMRVRGGEMRRRA